MASDVTLEELDSLRQSVRGFLARRSPVTEVRRLMEDEVGFDTGVWLEMAEQLGLQGLVVPEQFGGAGYGPVEQAVVLEEMGRAMFGAPYFSSAVAATALVTHVGDEGTRAELLPRLAAGEVRATAAIAESGWEQGLTAPTAGAMRSGSQWTVSGEKRFVLDGESADVLLVTASTPSGVSLFAVEASAPGIARRSMPTLDLTRKMSVIGLSDAPARLVGAEGDAAEGLGRASDVILAALAAEQVGGAQRCLEMIVDYLKVRVQFGRVLGSFQALKHRCADLVVAVETARAIAASAADAASEEDWESLSTLAALAKAECSDVFAHASAENVQLHGGIGFTWEHDAHLYFKRARTSRFLFGEPSRHRARAATGMGL